MIITISYRVHCNLLYHVQSKSMLFYFWLLQQRPDPAIRAKNKRLLDATFLHTSQSDDEDLEGTPLTQTDREQAAEFLLMMDSGDWSSDAIIHHCGIGCCNSVKESRLKLWVAIQVAGLNHAHFLKPSSNVITGHDL